MRKANSVVATTSGIFQRYVVPCWSSVQLSLVAAFCLKVYYEHVANRDARHLAHFSYLIMIANACAGLLRYTNDDTYCDLRILLDYGQLVLALPLIVTEFLLKNEVVPAEVAYIPTGIAFATFLMFIFLEYKRQDLTDLNVITSILCYIIVGYAYSLYAFVAGLIFGLNYFLIKRREECFLKKANQFNLLMSAFALMSLLSLDPNCLNVSDDYPQEFLGE
ncbi:uncharacterized protein LOC126892207 [Diabrotica virgifera virgifera]|uniref:Uncharacterized protein LOC114345677 n=1 Tax=Diabrotica virgifera virgifera TaxID=50390 RepID=A0A6P7H3K1_DIAVI|nr:uncharacterized protein LOC126892207 [Diabrotica virgifera virgifera]